MEKDAVPATVRIFLHPVRADCRILYAMKNIATLTADSLIQNGIKSLYCVPGIQNDHFFNALFDRQDQIEAIHARHEQGAVYMALGAALATGQPQAFSIVPGPGFLNGCAALCTAYALNAPLFGVIGQIPSGAIGKGLGLLHEIEDQLTILKSLTKKADRIIDGATAETQLAGAWQALRSGRPRPVGVEIPVNSWLANSDYKPDALAITASEATTIADTELQSAIELINAAKHPLIVVGSGAQAHSSLIRELAPKISAGVIAFRTGHGVMDSRHALSITMPVGHRLWSECDLVIGLGTRLTSQKLDWGLDNDINVLHIDVDQTSLDKISPPTLGINADLAHALPKLLEKLPPQPDRTLWTQRIKKTKSEFTAELAKELNPQLDWLNAIREALPEDGIFVDELTQIGYVSRFSFPCYLPRTFLSTGYQGTLGYGIATALGAAHAKPETPVVSIAGDGGAMFTIAELATAVHHKIPLNVVVMNDNAFGNVKGIQRDKYDERYIASDLTSPDFVKLAESLGVKGARATTPDELWSELNIAIKHPGPNLIEVPVGEFPSPWKHILLPKVR